MSPTAEVIELADSRPVEVDQTTERGRAFARLAEVHLDAAYRLARAILRDPGEAQDATHDAFLQAWRKWPSLKDPARFERWFDRSIASSGPEPKIEGAKVRATQSSQRRSVDPVNAR